MFDIDHPFADRRVAELYDAFPFEADVPFYVDLASGTGGRVLEVACGTGRLLLPLARAGHHVVGVDASPHMLAVAERKLEALDADQRAHVRLVQADMRRFDVGGEFDLAVVAVRSFGYLLTVEDQLAALGALARHLRPGGVLALDLLHPLPAWLIQPEGSLRQDLCEPLADGSLVTRTEAVARTDLARQVRVTRSLYEVVDPAGGVSKRVVQWVSRFTYRFEAEHLLQRSGFVVEAVYGGYRGEPFRGDSATMLVQARREGS